MYRGIIRTNSIANPFANVSIDANTSVTYPSLLTQEYFDAASEKDIETIAAELLCKQKTQDDKIEEQVETTKVNSNVDFIRSILIPEVSSRATTVATPIATPPRVAWIDCEMSGLDPNEHTLLELSCVVTEFDEDLSLVAEHETIAIYQNEETIGRFNEWCTINHAKSGLTDRVRESTTSMKEAEEMLLQFLNKFTTKNVPLAGNSVYVDKMFINRHMPKLDRHFSYRLIDVSSLSQLCRAWNYQTYSGRPNKIKLHRARADIYESIQELKYYQKFFLRTLKKR